MALAEIVFPHLAPLPPQVCCCQKNLAAPESISVQMRPTPRPKKCPRREGLAMVATVTALPEAVALSSERALPHKTPRTKTCFFGPIQMSVANLALEERGTGNWGSIG